MPMPIEQIDVLDELLSAHGTELGEDFVRYRNHAYRVANLCLARTKRDAATIEKVGIAAALHDMGIWTDGTFDYLAPSIRVAARYLADTGRADWTGEISAMILEHHKITPCRARPDWLVEPFRRADWTDVTWGAFSLGQTRKLIRELYALWPDEGFHALLIRLELRHLRKHPLNPLPVVRL